MLRSICCTIGKKQGFNERVGTPDNKLNFHPKLFYQHILIF